MKHTTRELLETMRVIVCCGAGGVGKTSIAASLALAGAKLGKRVLVLTIDPSKRLAETLGVSRHQQEPVPISAQRFADAGVEVSGSLSAWMLDPQTVSDAVVQRLSGSNESAKQLLNNKIYKNVTAMVAGMQEYTAVEALHGFVKDDAYDLIILDTPPSRNALHFLDAPNRITEFLDGRVFRFFLPKEGSLFQKATSKILERVLHIALGKDSTTELLTFFKMFSGILLHLGRDAKGVREFFAEPTVAFVIVTSPEKEALLEAEYFKRKTTVELGLNLCGVYLNRTLLDIEKHSWPGAKVKEKEPQGELRSALEKLQVLADSEKQLIEGHRKVYDELCDKVSAEQFTVALPYLSEGVSTLRHLTSLASRLCTIEV